MRYMRSLMVAFGLTSLVTGVAFAGINPGNPGLPYQNNQSAICIDCHSVAPGGATHYGSHFVYNPMNTASGATNSGGGGSWARTGLASDNGAYFKVTQWNSHTYSKYGGGSDNQSYVYGGTSNTRGAATLNATASSYASREIICESCHNLVSNVAGGNNLVAVLTSATYTANTGDNVQVVGTADNLAAGNVAAATDAPLCVGCHGYLYTAGSTSTGRFADTRNNNEVVGTAKKGNNHFHVINGTSYPQNHHVMTGDAITNAQASLGLLWRDVLVVPPTASTATMSTASTLGQMPQRAAWDADGGKPTAKSGANFTCISCHAAPHSGNNGTAASILRDTNAGGESVSARGTLAADGHHTTAIARLGENNRTWMGFSDVNYCNDCHELKAN